MVGQIVKAFFIGLSILPETLLSMLSFKEIIDGIPDQIWAAIIGVPTIVISLIFLVINIFKFLQKGKRG